MQNRFHAFTNELLKVLVNLGPSDLTPLIPHEGKSLFFKATDSPFSLTLKIQDHRFILVSQTENPTTTLTGRTVDLGVAFLKKESGPHALMSNHLNVEGDTSLLQAFHQVMHHLAPDVEGLIAKFTGDLMATQMTLAVKTSWLSFKQFVNDRAQDLTHFATFEKKILVNPDAFETFKHDVQVLRGELEKLERTLDIYPQQMIFRVGLQHSNRGSVDQIHDRGENREGNQPTLKLRPDKQTPEERV